jgi:hypothetical protein
MKGGELSTVCTSGRCVVESRELLKARSVVERERERGIDEWE